MSGYEPGTVAKVQCSDGEWRTAIFGNRVGIEAWTFQDGAWRYAHESTARPLVVLDPESGLLDDLRSAQWCHVDHGRRGRIGRVADQIEAQTKPPKPPEPTGLGAVVEDAEGKRWVRVPQHDHDLNKPWRDAEMGAIRRHWQIVDAIRVLSEGVQS